MPYALTLAFVLGTEPLKEQDKLVHLLTQDRGIIKAVAPGALKFKNRFGSLLELFTEGEFTYYWQEEKELVTLSKGEIVNSYFQVVSLPENIFYCYLVAEVLLKFVPYQHRDRRVYRLLDAILKNRAAGIEIDLLLLYFLVWILRIEGMMFNPKICHNCFQEDINKAWLKTDFRGILCQQCRLDERFLFDSGDLQFLNWIQDHSPRDLPQWKNKIDRARLIRIFKQKIEYHGEFILKTAQYLTEFS